MMQVSYIRKLNLIRMNQDLSKMKCVIKYYKYPQPKAVSDYSVTVIILSPILPGRQSYKK